MSAGSPSSLLSDDPQGDGVSFQRNILSADKVPMEFKMKIEEQKRKAALEASKETGKTPKDIEWDMFLSSKLTMNDDDVAEQHLNKYVDFCAVEHQNLENVCYELFVDFSQGRQKIKSDRFAEDMIKRFSHTRDVNKLTAITSFFEKNRNGMKAEAFYYTLYEIFERAEGVSRDLNKAAKYLKSAIEFTNNHDRRANLRKIYEEQNPNLPNDERMCAAYEKVIADNIRFAKTDYADYLKTHDKRLEAMHWYAADGEYKKAYEIINIRIKKEIDKAVEEFRQGAADSEFSSSLKSIQKNFGTLQNIFEFSEIPLTYWGMAWRYTLFGSIYAIYRTIKFDVRVFIAALILTVAATVAGGFVEHVGAVLTAALWIWLISILIYDILRRSKFVDCCKLWTKLTPHPKLKDKDPIFAHSTEILTYSSKSWTLIIPVVFWTLTLALTAFGIENSDKINEQIQSTNPKIQSEGNENITVTPISPKSDSELKKDDIPKPEKPSTEHVPAKPIDEHENIVNTINKPQKESAESIMQKNPTLSHTDFGKAFDNYYKAINDKKFEKAYSYLTKKCRDRLGNLESFANGRKNTLSVEVTDFQQTAASNNRMTGTYQLRSRDKVSGRVEVKNFAGNVTMIKSGNDWLIDEISSKLINSHIE